MRAKQNKEKSIIYDKKRDSHLEVGDVIYIHEDGSRKLVKAGKGSNNG